jgi:V-type H+-transporting ATPase subunit a
MHVLQIIVKWIFFWVEEKVIFGNHYPGPNCSPSLLIGLINMFMLKSRESGFDRLVTGDDAPPHYEQLEQCHLQQWYPNQVHHALHRSRTFLIQGMIEMVLLFIAVICIPIMLLVKPFYQRYRAARGLHVGGHGHGGDGEEVDPLFGA